MCSNGYDYDLASRLGFFLWCAGVHGDLYCRSYYLAVGACGWRLIMSFDLFKKYLWDNKMVWIGGRLGGGKTALAHYIAHAMMTDKRYGFRWLVSNVPSVWADTIEDVTNNLAVAPTGDALLADAVMILDEGGIFLKTAREADRLKFLRKMNILCIVSSRTPPNRDLQVCTVRRTYNGYSAGLPFWRYKFGMSDGSLDEEFNFNWWRPSNLFGVYDTRAMPEDAEMLLDGLDVWIKKGQEFSDRVHGRTRHNGNDNWDGNDTTADSGNIQRIADELAATVDQFGRLSEITAKRQAQTAKTLSRRKRG